MTLSCVFASVLFLFLTALRHSFLFFFFNDTATTEIYTLSLHDALPILGPLLDLAFERCIRILELPSHAVELIAQRLRSEEHTSELQSPDHLVCRLLLEKKKKRHN